MSDRDARPEIEGSPEATERPASPRRSRLPRSREASLALVLTALIVIGIGLDRIGGAVPSPSPNASHEFVSRARFCPPAPKGGTSRATIVTAAAGEEALLGLEPLDQDKSEVTSDRLGVRPVPEPVAVDAVGYEGPIVASSAMRFETPVAGVGAASCAAAAAHKWYLPEGSTALGFDQRILVYNPFPDEAVVAVTLFTPEGRRAKANLSDVAVPAHSSVGLAVNDYILRPGALGASVVTQRGRVVVWRALLAKPEGLPHGGQLSLASPVVSRDWYFPDGGVGPGYEERISVLNPSREEAVLQISLVAGSEVIQPPKLVEVTVAPGTVRAFWLPNLVGGTDSRVGGAGAIVRSINGTEVVAERTVWYEGGDLEGVSSEVGAIRGAREWWVPPASLTPATDSLVVLNATTEKATVDIRLVGTNDEMAPRALQGVSVPAYGRVRIPINAITNGRPMSALITSDVAVVAERTSYSSAAGDVASVLGIALDRITGR